MKDFSNRDFKILSDREHVLCRPGMYLGSISLTEKEQWVYSKQDEKFYFKKVNVVPAVLKCASELVDNSIDVAIDTNFKYATKIKVKVDSKSIEVSDDGIGIPCVPPDGITSKDPSQTCACLAWTKLKAGTSFDDNRKKIGTNGVGSSCVNVFSKVFIGSSDDGKKKQKIECYDNMSIIKPSKVTESSGKSGVTVYCEPDLERFGLKVIDQLHIDLIYQRLVNLALSYPKIKFTFNGEKIAINEKKFSQMFSDSSVIASTSNATICVFPNAHDEFKFYACVNGIDTFRGGSHVDFITMEIANRVRDKLVKKYKSIRPGDIKNKLGIAIMLTGFVNPQFDSQTKESLANSNSEISKHLDGQLDFDKLAKEVLKNNAIIDPIVETFKIKEELKARQELKQAKKVKVKSDKYFPGIGDRKYLFLVEGLSAGGGLMKCLGRNGKYYYCLRGLALNAYDSSIQKIAANQEIKDVMQILGIDLSKTNVEQEASFEKIVIATDADLDGINISSMLLGWWYKLCPELYPKHKIYKLNTPVVVVKDSNENLKEWFFTLDDFKEWEAKNQNSKLKIVYLKGLGALETKDLDHIIEKQGFDSLLEEYSLDETAGEYFENWLGDNPEPRKKYMKEYTFDINKI